MSHDTLKRLADPQVIALRCKGDAWPRSLLAQTLIPDTWMGLVVSPDGRRRFVPAGEDPRPDNADTLVLVRNRAITVPLAVTEVPAADHPVSASVEVLFRCPARDDELAALHKTLLAAEELTLEGLMQAVNQAAAATALRQFIRGRSAGQLVHEDQREPLLDHLRAALQRFLFSSGLVLERLGQVELVSESLAQQETLTRTAARRVEEIKSRDMVEQAALAATRRRLDDLSGLFDKLKQAAGDDTGRWGELLPALTPAERGRLLENLWRVTPDQHVAQAIVAVAGCTCVWLAPANADHVQQRISVDEALGGLRSVSFSPERGWLLLGAARGVWVLNAADGAVVGRYEVPEAGQPRTGFNAAVIAGERLFATHSQLGCWSWLLAQPDQGTALLRPAAGKPKTIRAVTADARGQALFAADDCVHVVSATGEELRTTSPVTAPITCLATLEDEIYVGTADGRIWSQRPTGHPGLADADTWCVVHRAGSALESIIARRWGDLVELVIPAGADGVCAVYAEAGVLARLMDSPTPIRRVWASDDALVGLNENRDRLVVLHSAMPGRTGRAVPLARELGAAIQDACLVTSDEAAPGGAGVPPANKDAQA
jgi:hypothetical protein